ncbi:hypothetical protein, partial [Mycobacterium avium]|uniref:hypothetical protein n=1 Tax=Mycobacterium avium TaxID=1764 RepID=UPI001E5DE5BE
PLDALLRLNAHVRDGVALPARLTEVRAGMHRVGGELHDSAGGAARMGAGVDRSKVNHRRHVVRRRRRQPPRGGRVEGDPRLFVGRVDVVFGPDRNPGRSGVHREKRCVPGIFGQSQQDVGGRRGGGG